MTPAELRRLVSGGESERVEFKRSTGQRTEAAKTVCAMLNGLGGFVVFGVSNRGELIGQQVGVKTLEDVAAELRRIEPPAFPDVETVNLKKENAAILLTVPGGGGPYTFDGRAYLRHGPTTRVMPRAEYERRLVERLHATRRWENEPVVEGVTVKDLDTEEIRITLDNAIRLGRLEPTGRRDLQSVLRGLELIRDGQLLNAAVALYGKSDRLKTIYPQMSLRLARFRGKDRLTDFADNRQYWGHAFALLRRAESFLMDHVPIAGRIIPGKMIREDKPWYPPRATREALANAFCHRDYVIPGGAVAVAVYDDHLEVTNPGVFHFGITPESLSKPHESRPWNPIIANVFYRAGVIERWGSGTLNIVDWCVENGNPAPTWKEEAGSVFVIFAPATLRGSPQVTGEVGREVTGEVTGEVVGQVTGEVLQLLRILTAPKTRAELQRALGLKGQANFRDRYLRPALDGDLIKMNIPDKPRSSKQRYRLTEKGRRVMTRLDEVSK
jgi:ATP-dependent DNA helicase RecG